MINTDSLTKLVEQQISESVDQYIKNTLDNQQWLTDLEQRIVSHVQDRITARFTNISTMPDLVLTVQSSVAQLIRQGLVPGIENYLDPNTIAQAMDQSIQDILQRSLDSLLLDQDWVTKVESIATQEMTQKVLQNLSMIDINSVIADKIKENLPRWQKMLMQDFASTGISDNAKSKKITVSDDQVKIGTKLITDSLEITEEATFGGAVKIKDLSVTGSINTDNASWNELADRIGQTALEKIDQQWRSTMAQEVIDLAKNGNIDFASVSIKGQPLVDGNRLNGHITESNLQNIGTLKSLSVSGGASINETLTVNRSRVGINTDSPEMALAIWDEEISVVVGKLSKHQAFVGTARNQKLSLGTNRQSMLEIDGDGLTTVKQLRIDRWKIGHTNSVPGWSGTRGDIMFNHDFKPDTPFAWVCLGAFRWQEIRLA